MIINNKTPVEVRPSQLLWTYGPGALIDLPSLSVVTLGIDDGKRIAVSRFRGTAARCSSEGSRRAGREPSHATVQKSELVDVWSAGANIGVPVRPFPRWMRCVKCGLLSPFDAGLFEIKEKRFRPDEPASFTKAAVVPKASNPPRMRMPFPHVSC
jgi:hypothetical protein